MLKHLATILLLLVMVGNSLVALPPHQASTGDCEAECCETARQTGSAATISGICCIVECPPSTELPAPISAFRNAPQQIHALNAGYLSIIQTASYLQQMKFPSAPTRWLQGSSSRYLDACSFLI